MPIVNRIAEFAEDMKAWRRHLHQNPELGFDCHETRLLSRSVCETLASPKSIAVLHNQAWWL